MPSKFSVIRIMLIAISVIFIMALLVFAHSEPIGNRKAIPELLPDDKKDSYALEIASHLPILVMQTDVASLRSREIPPGAVIWFFDNRVSNSLSDTPTAIFELATTYYRGAFSRTFPQRPYKISLYHNDNSFIEPLDYSFFDLEPASEWVLRSLYADKSLMRDWYSYELAATVLNWQPKGGMLHVFLQDSDKGMIEYQGVYFMSQYIPTAARTELGLEEFSLNAADRVDYNGGGYLYQRDRVREYSTYAVMPDDIVYRVMHPGSREITSAQWSLVVDEITFYHNFLSKKGEFAGIADNEWDYWNYIEIDSFIDYFLVGELLKILDVGLFSTYMYRQIGGKLIMGPLWDGDWSMGNYISGADAAFFIVLQRDMISSLLTDASFAARLVETWQSYRGGVWSDAELFSLFDSMANYLVEPAAYNSRRWPEIYEDSENLVRSRSLPFTASWEEEIAQTRSWFVDRLIWLDEHIPMLLHESASDINHAYQEYLEYLEYNIDLNT